MIARLLSFLLVSATIVSCTRWPPKTEEYSGWYYELENASRAYHHNYFEPPGSMDDLLHFIELDGSLLSEGYMDQSYEFLKKHRKQIIVVSLPLRELLTHEELKEYGEEALGDLCTAMFFKNTILKNLVGFIPFDTPCNMERATGRRTFFDKNGDPIMENTRHDAYNRDLKEHLRNPVAQAKFPDIKWKRTEGRSHDDFVIVEYTRENGLWNVCDNKQINIANSAYFTTLSELLQGFMQENPELSRIILAFYIPVE